MRYRGNDWRHLPEVVDLAGAEIDPDIAQDDFGMPTPSYLRMDLVDKETKDAYELGIEEGERRAMARWGMDLPDPLPGRRKRRVIGT